MGVDQLAEVNLDVQHTTTETNRPLPHNLHAGLLCYWLQDFLKLELNTDRNQKVTASILTTLSCT
jgi:hypothetical protein